MLVQLLEPEKEFPRSSGVERNLYVGAWKGSLSDLYKLAFEQLDFLRNGSGKTLPEEGAAGMVQDEATYLDGRNQNILLLEGTILHTGHEFEEYIPAADEVDRPEENDWQEAREIPF